MRSIGNELLQFKLVLFDGLKGIMQPHFQLIGRSDQFGYIRLRIRDNYRLIQIVYGNLRNRCNDAVQGSQRFPQHASIEPPSQQQNDDAGNHINDQLR
ncbi:hypothetical protein SDC9_107610 [bioreactor metagenome]|uniref:Uncharacterized protein n=1 Tax=bioreactor metagenome TaxID=1076179 RepID=A0A645B6S3_9ZZZZ